MSPEIVFGFALLRHLVRIYNVRISYPNKDTYIWDDDVAGAYRIPKYNPAVALAFASAIMEWLFLPTGDVFGSKTSPHEYEPFARARALLAEHLSRDQTLVMKHADILQAVEIEVEPNPNEVHFVSSKTDSINKGVFRPGTNVSMNTLIIPLCMIHSWLMSRNIYLQLWLLV